VAYDVEPGRFEDMVVTALDGLPEELGRLMRNVAVTVEHDPGPPGLLGLYEGIVDRFVDQGPTRPTCRTIDRLPSGSWRVKVYAGIDPLTGREIRFRKTCKTERAARIELGRLLAQAAAGRQPDSAVTVARLLDQYVLTAGWDVSTRESNLGYIRRPIKLALGSMPVRKIRGPLRPSTARPGPPGDRNSVK
jgi:hypothetical protein